MQLLKSELCSSTSQARQPVGQQSHKRYNISYFKESNPLPLLPSNVLALYPHQFKCQCACRGNVHPREIRSRRHPHHKAPHPCVLGICTPPAPMCCHGGSHSCLEGPCQGGCGLPTSTRGTSRDATAHVGGHKSAATAFGFCLENISSKKTGLDSPGEESTNCSGVAQSTVHFWTTASDTQANPKTLQTQGRKYTAAKHCWSV